MGFILYHTLGCHLCEHAEDVIESFNKQDSVRAIGYVKTDIADDERLVALYGIRIPVLCHDVSQQTLDWPFDEQQLSRFIAQTTANQ